VKLHASMLEAFLCDVSLQAGKTSLIKALMSPSSKCAVIDLDNRTIAIDTYDMQLPPTGIVDDDSMIVGDDSTIGNIDDGGHHCHNFEGSDSSLSENHEVIGEMSLDVSNDPVFDVKIWDLGGQDVYMLSHTVHFTHRCIYMLLWRPLESIDEILSPISLWLESLCMHVPDAHVVLVGSHCRSSLAEDEFAALSAKIEFAARLKLKELNETTRLEVDNLRSQLSDAVSERQFLQDNYERAAAMCVDDANFLLHYGQVDGTKELFAARKEASHPKPFPMNFASIHPPLHLPMPPLPRSLRKCAAEVYQAFEREERIRTRLQRLLGIRNGAPPDDRAACQMALHCKYVDSVQGHGIRELKSLIYDHCRSLPFMGEMISSNWIAIADVFKYFGDSVLSQSDAIALVRRHLPPLKYNLNVSDDEIWAIIDFWSLVGRIFVYESQVLRDPSTLIALLKPLLHHHPLEMMRLPAYQSLLVEASLQRVESRVEISSMLNRLYSLNELPMQLLDHLSAWKDLSGEQRSSMLAFFEHSRLLCRIDQRPDVRLVTSRVRSKPYLAEDIDRVTASAVYHALYLLSLNNIALIANLQSTVCSFKLEYVNLKNVSGRDSLLVHRTDDPFCACVFSVESFVVGVEQNQRFSGLCGKLGDAFSCVLRVASSDFGMFKFAAACADAVIDSDCFASRHQCWVAVDHSASNGSALGLIWTLFRDSTQRSQPQRLLCSLSLSQALACNLHETVIPGYSIMRMFQPRSSIFVSHAWGDGTGEFIQRLKTHLERQTLASVWVDTDGLNQKQEILIPAFRSALCQARVVFVVLTPSYLTRPNCVRELRWALDFERAGHLRVVLLSMHPAMAFDARLQLVLDGTLKGMVFSLKEKKVKRLCPEAIALLERLNDVHMNTLPWHELQAWRSDVDKSNWEEHRQYKLEGVDKTVDLAGGPDGLVEQTVNVIKGWLVCVAPRPVSECATMDDTRALTASDVTNLDDVCSVLDKTCYSEEAAASLKKKTEKLRVAAVRFRRRCIQAASACCALLLFLLLFRAGRLPLRLQRLIASLLLRLRRR
jgi:GTPase SAR1 family protein